LTAPATPRRFYVYNAHLQHDAGTDPELTRVRSVLLLGERIANRGGDDPVVVAGDFNATPTSVPIRYLTDARRDPIEYCPASAPRGCIELRNTAPLIDVWRHLFPESETGTYPCPNAERRIDYVLVSPPARPLGARTEAGPGGCASDHWAVIAEILLPPS
jgi:endonuclease/exonuclease/phosphatase family metal-dependent hydrolase